MILANGFNWQRYRVLFDNGAELGDLDSRQLEPIGRAAKRLAKAREGRRPRSLSDGYAARVTGSGAAW